METIQAVTDVRFCEGDVPGEDCVRWLQAVPLESVVDIYGLVVGDVNVRKCSIKNYELHVNRAFIVSRAAPTPIAMADAQRKEAQHDENGNATGNGPHVSLDTRLNYRYFDLRTPANQAIMRIQSMVGHLYRKYLDMNGFIEIHTPKINAGTSEGGSEVFRLDYFRREACLA